MDFNPQVREIAVPRHCRLVGNPSEANDNRLRYMAQSILIGQISGHYLPTTAEARDILAWAKTGVRV